MHERLVEDGKLPPDVFEANCEHGMTPTPCVEIVVVKMGARSVLLMERPETDKYFTGMATPGTVVRRNDDIDIARKRALGEFGNTAVGDLNELPSKTYDTARGRELALIHYIVVSDDTTVDPGKGGRDGFFPIDALPQDTLDFHKDMIRIVAENIF